MNEAISQRGDMSTFAENFAHEDYFMQQARANGEEVGAADPTPGVGNFLKFAVQISKAKSVVEIGTGSGVGGLWLLSGMTPDGVLQLILSESIQRLPEIYLKKLILHLLGIESLLVS